LRAGDGGAEVAVGGADLDDRRVISISGNDWGCPDARRGRGADRRIGFPVDLDDGRGVGRIIRGRRNLGAAGLIGGGELLLIDAGRTDAKLFRVPAVRPRPAVSRLRSTRRA